MIRFHVNVRVHDDLSVLRKRAVGRANFRHFQLNVTRKRLRRCRGTQSTGNTVMAAGSFRVTARRSWATEPRQRPNASDGLFQLGAGTQRRSQLVAVTRPAAARGSYRRQRLLFCSLVAGLAQLGWGLTSLAQPSPVRWTLTGRRSTKSNRLSPPKDGSGSLARRGTGAYKPCHRALGRSGMPSATPTMINDIRWTRLRLYTSLRGYD